MRDTLSNLVDNQWLTNIGKTPNLDIALRYDKVNSLEEALKNLESTRWENTTLEALNFLSVYLHQNYREEHSKWSVYLSEGNLFLMNNIVPELERLQWTLGLPQFVIDSIKFGILGAYMETTYSGMNHKSSFFKELVKVYASGHLPCGWKGKYPKGYLLVY